MPYFLNPSFIGALALVGIPLLIHLIRRRKLRVVKWAAMEFLRQSQRKQRRRLRIEELILLALRMLIVAAAVLAFARPVLRALGLPILGQNARIYAVIVLDNSFSMDQRGPDGRTSWQRAQAEVDVILTRILKPGDSASLVLGADGVQLLVGAPSFDLPLVSRRARSASIADRGTDYLAAAREVDALLKASKAPYKEVYWLSDDQSSGWASSKKESAHAVWADLSRQARVTWVSVGAPADRRGNLAVHLLPPARELVTPHLPARIEARIANYSPTSHNNLLVNLKIDGNSGGSKSVSLAPGGSALVDFEPYLPTAGAHVGSIELTDAAHADVLPRDNAAPFVIRSRDRIRVLLQDMHPNADAAKSDSFYLLTALAPGGAAESVAPHLHEGPTLGGASLREDEAIILTGLSSLDAQDLRALSDYVRAGGGLLVFPGDATDPGPVNAQWSASNLLPARLGARRNLTEDAAVTLNPATLTERPPLTMFKDTSNLNLGSARFTRYLPLEPVGESGDASTAQVMVRFSNGDPAFVERQVGLGRVILAASSAGAGWNQLPLKAAYLPLIYQLVSYLSAGPNAHRNLRQDEPLLLTLPLADANKPVSITYPDGHVTTQNSVLKATGVTLSFTDTRAAGVYRVAVAGKNLDAFAVNLPADESDLTPPADLQHTLVDSGIQSSRLDLARTPEELAAAVHRSRYGAEAWRPLVWLVILLLFLESLLAQQFGHRG
jgi:hypothetical protein